MSGVIDLLEARIRTLEARTKELEIQDRLRGMQINTLMTVLATAPATQPTLERVIAALQKAQRD